ncbi:hypothetical protein LSH36_804g00073 [Paralvinella palmiformis]|uniref:Uncharacterized protein n=1 Tax=Paralvinella palmiformis TaxID=53620 RepID=A0AAD9J1F6_9ANNE|nr:hypothetical protein LSH36_804g00073 [Paralvinella palmiformis]
MFVFIDFLVLTSGRYTCQRACQTFALSRNYHTHIKTRTETAYLVVIVFTEANDTRRAFDILSQCTPTKYHILTACKAFMYMTSLDYDSTNDCSAIIRAVLVRTVVIQQAASERNVIIKIPTIGQQLYNDGYQ